MRILSLLIVLAGFMHAADDPRVTAFSQRVNQYVKVRDAAKRKVGAMPKAATPEKIEAQEKKLVDEIRANRMDAKLGDIFTPDIQPLFSKILRDTFAGPKNEDNRETARIGNPRRDKEVTEAAPVVEVNAVYSKSAPLSSVPPMLLLELPKLPMDIEYRFVGQTLILWDNISNIIIDYMKGAAPSL